MSHIDPSVSSSTSPPKPTPITYSFSKIPAYLRERPQWVCWRYELVNSKYTKVPMQAKRIGAKAATTRPEEWTSFELAVSAYELEISKYDGIGYCLADGEEIVGIDLDHVVTMDEQGKVTAIEQTAQDIIASMRSYAEISVSGTGVHIFVFGVKPGDRCKDGSFEMYSRDRFLTFTGRKLLSASPTIEHRQDEIAALYLKHFPALTDAPTDLVKPLFAPDPRRPALTDEQVIERAGAALNGAKFTALMAGDTSGYPSHNEADLALCDHLAFWTKKDAEQIDRIFRQSKLMRPKWEMKRGAGTYGSTTIEKAMTGTGEVYGSATEPPANSDVKSTSDSSAEPSWPPLQPLPDTMPAAPPLTREMLPPVLGNWVFDIAYRMNCPPDYPAVAAMVALATVVGKKLTIRPKGHDNWIVVVNLWGQIIGPPGVLKTPAITAVFGPLYRAAAEAREEHKKSMGAYKRQLVTYEVTLAALKEKLKAALKKGEGIDAAQTELDALPEPVKPVERRYITNDSTVEKLGMMLNENPNGMLVKRDEQSGLFAQMDSKGHEQDRSFYIEAWDGLQGKAIDRVIRGSLWVERCILSMIGTIQPGPLGLYLERFYGEADDGFIERFQLSVYPTVPVWKRIDQAPNTAAATAAGAVFTRMMSLKDECQLQFSPDAQELFWAWLNGIEVLVRDPALHPIMQSHVGKYRSLMPSLALLFQVALSPVITVVGAEATRMAIAWCEYLLQHARRMFWSVIEPNVSAVRLMARRARSLVGEGPMTARDIARKHWAGLGDLEVVEEALLELEKLGWFKGERIEYGGRAGKGRVTIKWEANPAIRSASNVTNVSCPSPVLVQGPRGMNLSLSSSSSVDLDTPRQGTTDVGDVGQDEELPF